MNGLTRALIFAALLPAPTASAHNNLFFPGDAFFSTRATSAQLKDALAHKTWAANYERLSLTLMLCGYAGYRSLIVENFEGVRAERLIRVVRSQSKNAEKGRVLILLYNKDFDLKAHRVGLTYNEHWEKETLESGHDEAIYSGAPESLREENDKNAPAIPALSLSKPRGKMQGLGGAPDPIFVDFKDLQFVVIPERPFRRARRKARRKPYISLGPWRPIQHRAPGAYFFTVTEKIWRTEFSKNRARTIEVKKL